MAKGPGLTPHLSPELFVLGFLAGFIFMSLFLYGRYLKSTAQSLLSWLNSLDAEWLNGHGIANG